MRIATLPPEYNMRVGVPTTVVGRVRLLHGHVEDPEALAARFNSDLAPRSYPRQRPVRRLARQAYRRVRRSIEQRTLWPSRGRR